MRKEITITINYGRDKTKDFLISIVPNKFIIDFHEYASKHNKLEEIENKYKGCTDPIKLTDGLKEMEKLDLKTIVDERFDLIATVLIANDYIKDKSEFDFNFWNTKVSPPEITEFLALCFLKDNDIEQIKKKSKIM